MGRQPDHFYEFGAFRVDVTERLLLRDGEPVPLPPKVFDTLLVLVENNGHLVERDVLMKLVWPDTFVEDANLTVNVSALRKLLGEGSADGCYIETVPRRGYRFSGRVREVREEDGHPCAASNLIEQEAGGGRDGIDRTFQRKATDTGSHADTPTESRDGAGFSPNTPPPKVTSSRANNLPIQPTPFIGREAEASAVDKLLRQPEVRLLTLTGPGGAGKTRLGLQVAAAMIDEFESGICFVSLAVIRDPGLVVSAIAKALGISESGDRPLTDSLKDSLREKQILLLLDNFEQVISAALLVSELLGSCPRLKVLVTSRAVLHLRGEHEFAVPPLELPDPKRPSSVEALLQYASVALFIQRALEVKPDFVMSDETSNAVAEICIRLDGLPLAIELAAARVKLLPPQGMLARFGSRLKLLTGGARDLPARQHTMQETIAWSYDLLEDGEKRLFRRLAVFVGGFTLEAAEAVSNATGDLGKDALDVIASLMDKSLLYQKDQAGSEARFVMLETIREYALECLTENAEAEALQRRHADFFLSLAEGAELELTGPRQAAWLERLEREHNNLRAALHWSKKSGEIEIGLRMAGSLFRFWGVHGHLSEGRKVLETLLALTGHSDVPVPVRAKAIRAQGFLAGAQGDYTKACSFHEKSLALYRQLGDKRGIALSLNSLATVAYYQTNYERMEMLVGESLALFRELGDKWGIAASLNNLGALAYSRGDYERMKSLYEESLALRQELGDEQGIAVSIYNLGNVAQRQGDYKQAGKLFEESLIQFRELGDKWGVADSLEQLAEVACSRGQLQRAAQLFGAAEAMREAIDASLPLTDRGNYDNTVAATRGGLPPEAFAAAWARGRRMTFEQAIAYALERNA